MNRSTVANRWNLELIEENYQRWSDDPTSVDATWQAFFEGYDLASQGFAARDGGASEAGAAQSAVTRLIDAYREIGHYLADLDPLRLTQGGDPNGLLELSSFGLTEADLDRTFHSALFDPPQATLRDLIAALRETYCGSIGVEFMYIRNPQVRDWIQKRMEPSRNRPGLDIRQKRRVILKLNAAELFETFLHTHYVGAKRFSLEGGETLIPLLDALIEQAARHGVKEMVLGMPHRGRLNVLANTLDKPYGMIFGEFEDNHPETYAGDGDVKYHLGYSHDHVTAENHAIHLSLTPNPSHLEAVNPVVEGRMRAKQRRFKDRDRKLGVPILIHGDAAFAGQGLVAETLNLSQLTGYRTGGTVHVVVNNQIGFTTSPVDSRSTRYCTDVAKMIEVPIFHVNGDDPEAVVYVAELALDFREAFGQDVVIDLVCYRRHGHNEGDEPAFTQPLMYAAIKARPTVRALYTQKLIQSGELSKEEAETIAETFGDKLQAVYDEVHDQAAKVIPAPPGFAGRWKGFKPGYSFTPTETGVPRETLERIIRATATIPDGFRVNPKIQRQLDARLKIIETGEGIDWGCGEALAFGSLLAEGTPVRLSGQDSRRGTFSHRHAVLVDGTDGRTFTPLNTVSSEGVQLCVYDSLLSEAAVLGFDYGYSLDEPNMLILWEAQFGDFANGAQVIVDQFISSAESKWGRASGLVMLLPHGYEGQGPEHSSARLERFLALCADDNIQVVNATSPAQFFHLLRRQIKRDFRKPLIVMTPKSLLRAKEGVPNLSRLSDLTTGRFQEVIADPTAPDRVKRVVLCSGKVYYDLLAHRAKDHKEADVAILRLEQFYPWPEESLKLALGRHEAAREWVWCQEESENMGGWSFVAPRLKKLTGHDFDYVGRDASASPATGSHTIHDREQEELVEAAIGAAIPHLVSAYRPARPAVALTSKD